MLRWCHLLCQAVCRDLRAQRCMQAKQAKAKRVNKVTAERRSLLLQVCCISIARLLLTLRPHQQQHARMSSFCACCEMSCSIARVLKHVMAHT